MFACLDSQNNSLTLKIIYSHIFALSSVYSAMLGLYDGNLFFFLFIEIQLIAFSVQCIEIVVVMRQEVVKFIDRE